jgi:hypothetical protein
VSEEAVAPLLGKHLALLTNIAQHWKGSPGTSTSLLGTFVNYSRKKFYDISTWMNGKTDDPFATPAKFDSKISKKIINK